MSKFFAGLLVALTMSGSTMAFADEIKESPETSDWIKQTIAAAMTDGASATATPAKAIASGTMKVRIAHK
jgi:hypothetical protein